MITNNISILKNITILYAEDEKDLREVTHQILKGFTKKQYVAKDGAEGLELFKEHENEIDLIITDVNMPILNGLEMVKEIKKININIPIIVATAFSNKEYLLEAIDIGIDKYVLKPIDVSKLLQVMSQSLLYHELKDLYIDKLTNLQNRNRLKKDLETKDIDLMAILDIDDFSTMNDLFGEKTGDTILCELAISLKQHFEADHFSIYRTEADKFAILSKDHEADVNEFYKLCKDFAHKIEINTLVIDENEIDINVTIGIAQGDTSRIFKYSQRVISYARNKLEQVMIYDDSFNIQESFEENIKWVKKIKNGIKDNKFKAYYQPIVDNKTKEIYKYEALIRFIEDDGEVIAPFKFLDIAKKAKLYPHIIHVMLIEALNLIKAKNKRVAINISFEDIASSETKRFIYTELEKEKEAASLLEFEILESEEISDMTIVQEFIKRVKEIGCTVGVDDFGAGYSNFNMLTTLDIDFVKIDSSLIKEIDYSKNQEIIVNTISKFTKEFGFKTVAEFVSSEDIYEKVKSLEIDYSQGYFFGKPMSFDEV